MGKRDSKVSMVDDTTPAESTPARPTDVEDVAPAGAAPLDTRSRRGLDPEDVKFLRSLRSASSEDALTPRDLALRQQLSSLTLKQLSSQQNEIEPQPSVWDSALFQFASVSGRGASWFTLLLLMVNIMMQGSFAFYLMDGLTEKPITHNDIDQLRWWRRNVAHSLEYYNEAKGESLARRVCDNDFGIEASGVQAALHGTLNDYLGDYFKPSEKRFFGVGPGEYVAVISVFLDARGAFDTIAALQHIPRGRWESDIRLNANGLVEVARISNGRFAACVLVQLTRLAIGAILLWYGSLYIVYRIVINELILYRGLPGGMVRFPGIEFPDVPYAPVLNHTVLCTLKRLSCDEVSYTRPL